MSKQPATTPKGADLRSSGNSSGLILLLAVAVGAWLGLGGCNRPAKQHGVRTVVVHRPNCEVCHQPRNADGGIGGLEHAHPKAELSCTDCHGGTDRICDGKMGGPPDSPTCSGDWVYDKERAHVSNGSDPKFIKNLSSAELDEIDPDYLRFINPGDFRVAAASCGEAGCHQEAVDIVPRSTMAHTAGELAVARYRAGAQEGFEGLYAAFDVRDPEPPDEACAASHYERFSPNQFELQTDGGAPEGQAVANAQDQYMVKSCMRCHLNDFGENRFPGDYRSSGCSACHIPYADDGLSRSKDPRVSKESVPHPETHTLVAAPPTQQCTHCHYRGARIGLSYQGYREAGGLGTNPENFAPYGPGLHSHDPSFYIADEDTTNQYDETPPDVHFEAGMHCVDCHTKQEVHGNGHLYADTQCAVHTECEDCHGTARQYADPGPERSNLRWEDDTLVLRTKVSQRDLKVPQVKDSVTPGHPRYTALAEQSMGISADGRSHTDELECYTCHAAWVPTCNGCHVEMDFTRSKRYQTDGSILPGHPSGSRGRVSLFDLILMRNTDGKIAPSMPAERFFMTVKGINQARDADGNAAPSHITDKPRIFTFKEADGSPGRTIAGFGQRAVNPHTTRRVSQFMACNRCHSVGDKDDPSNKVLLDVTYGFGSERYPQEGCDVTNADTSCGPMDRTTYQLDRVIDRQGRPLVVVGHEESAVSRPLTLEEIDRMRAIELEPPVPFAVEIPDDAATNPLWPGPVPLQ